ncbi:MAG: 16S rRNA (adenine(1518)-N(6)/adenine(1519)-N(6))-dimethyltransferase RsmA, partial [Pirellulales bacterium]
MPASASNQTISYLGRRFAEAGIRLKPRHGQNFLIDQNLLRLIVERAAVDEHDVVLEVGTGTGALTALVAQRAAAVVTVEIDEELFQIAGEELIPFNNVVMLRADALANKSHLNPQVVAAVKKELAAAPLRRFKLVANLPFIVATPVMANLLASSIVPDSMTVTVQKEVAQRMVARAGSKDYGALGVWMQCQCRIELLRSLPPSVFWPSPKVNSAIVHVELDHARRDDISDLAFFHDFVRGLFLHRRKFLRGVLASAWKDKLDKGRVARILAQEGINPDSRAEQLDVATIVRLAEAVRCAVTGEK